MGYVVRVAGIPADKMATDTTPDINNPTHKSLDHKPTSRAEMGRGRRLAWQVALLLPCLVLVLTAGLASDAPRYAWQTASGVLVIALVLTASATDLRWHKIPNWATYSACLWGLLINGYAHFASAEMSLKLGAVGVSSSLLGALLPLIFMVLLFSVTGGGAGDVKLTAALGALLGLGRVIDAILCSFIVAGVLAVIRAIWLQGPTNLLSYAWRSIGHKVRPGSVLPPSGEQQEFMKQPMPLGPSFAMGTLMVLFQPNLEQLVDTAVQYWGGN